MSLKVWLPLNGNLNNNGSTTVTLSSGTPTYTNGKIGQCLSSGTLDFSVSNNLISTLGATNVYSLCCWCKNLDTTASSRWVFRIGSGAGITRGLWETNNTATRYWGYDGTGVNISASINPIDGKWHHICFTSNGSTVKLYIDGNYQNQTTSASTTAMTVNSFRLNATSYNLNDFRIYDHTLSADEVKTIAQGLLLHYPLDREGFGADNLALATNQVFTSAASTGGTNGSAYCPIIYLDPSVKENGITTSWKYTISFDYEVTGNSNTNAYIYDQLNGTSTGSSENVYKNPTGRYVRTHSPNETQAASTSNFYVRVRLRYGSDGAIVKIWNVKVEVGEKATPWVPNVGDTIYNKLQVGNNIVYDISGNSYHATNSNITYSSDTPKYNVSAVFDASTKASINNTLDANNILGQFTIAFWLKRNFTDTLTRFIYKDICQLYSYYSSGNYMLRMTWYHAKSASDYRDNTSDMGIKIPFNEWQHYVWTFNGGYLKTYVNGKYNYFSDRIETGQFMKPRIEKTLGGTSANSFIGGISDLRIYATELSADDILELYNERNIT